LLQLLSGLRNFPNGPNGDPPTARDSLCYRARLLYQAKIQHLVEEFCAPDAIELLR